MFATAHEISVCSVLKKVPEIRGFFEKPEDDFISLWDGKGK